MEPMISIESHEKSPDFWKNMVRKKQRAWILKSPGVDSVFATNDLYWEQQKFPEFWRKHD